MRHITIDIKDTATYRLRGSGRWADYGDSWLCAHDILHHLPNESGTAAEEVMTFGAELWLNYPRSGLNGILVGSLGEPLAENYTGRHLPKRFELPEVPLNFRRPPEKYMERFQEVAQQGMEACWKTASRQYERHHVRDLPEAWRARIAGAENVRRAADWMAFGYRVAQRRFPDAASAGQLFDKLEKLLDTLSTPLKSVRIALDERNYTVALA